MRCDIARGEVLSLMGKLKIPTLIKEEFAKAGIMQAIAPLSSGAGEIRYVIETRAFENVPDVVLKAMYADLKKFCAWYWQRKAWDEHRPQPQETGDVSAKEPPLCIAPYFWPYRSYAFSQIHHGHERDIEKSALYFAGRFIVQWRRYIVFEDN